MLRAQSMRHQTDTKQHKDREKIHRMNTCRVANRDCESEGMGWEVNFIAVWSRTSHLAPLTCSLLSCQTKQLEEIIPKVTPSYVGLWNTETDKLQITAQFLHQTLEGLPCAWLDAWHGGEQTTVPALPVEQRGSCWPPNSLRQKVRLLIQWTDCPVGFSWFSSPPLLKMVFSKYLYWPTDSMGLNGDVAKWTEVQTSTGRRLPSSGEPSPESAVMLHTENMRKEK